MTAIVNNQSVNDVGYFRQGGGGGTVAGERPADGRSAMGYYGESRGGDPVGRWHVSEGLAELLGLTEGEAVDPDVLEGVFENNVAPSGLELGQAHGKYTREAEKLLAGAIEKAGGAERITPERMVELRRWATREAQGACLGRDLTFNVEKGVTIAHAAADWAARRAERMGDPSRAERFASIRDGIERAILEANDAAMDYAASVMLTRESRHGATGKVTKFVEVVGTVRAEFMQSTNRDEGMHLHVHNPTLNRVLDATGEWRAIHAPSLAADRWAISAYGAMVLDEKLEALGLEVDLRRDGVQRELTAVDQAARDQHSTRSRTIRGKLGAEVTKAEERFGRKLTALEVDSLKRALTLSTRRAKVKAGEEESRAEYLSRWHAEHLDALGSGFGKIAERLLRQVEEGPKAAREFSERDVIARAVEKVAATGPTWTRGRLRHEIRLLIPSQGGMAPERVRSLLDGLVDKAIGSALVVEVSGAEGVAIPAELRREGVHYSSPSTRLYASSATLTGEDLLRRSAITRGRLALDGEGVDGWFVEQARRHGSDFALGADQEAMVRGLATSDAALAVVIGPPGAGKSTAVGTFAELWSDRSDGGKVHGLAISSIAAEVLAEDGLETTANVTAWLTAQDRLARGKGRPDDARLRLGRRDVVLVDEASMVDTAQLLRVREFVEAKGARLVLVGDPRQLPSIGAGGAMSLLDRKAETFTLTGIRRFAEAWERDATIRLRAGDTSVLGEYDRHGRIRQAETLDEALDEAARSALADRIEGRRTVVVTGTNEDASLVAGKIRAGLVAAGLVPDGPTVELAKHGGSVGVGDEVMCRKNDRRLGVLNRGAYRVTRVEEDGRVEVMNPKTAELFRLSARYVHDHVASAYASTVHAAQGLTVDACHWVTDGRADWASMLVALTRGRMRNTAYVATSPREQDRAMVAEKKLREDLAVGQVLDHKTPVRDAVAVLEDAMSRDGEAVAATVEAEREAARLTSASHLLGQVEDVVEQATRIRTENDLDLMVEEGRLSPGDRGRFRTDKSMPHVSKLLRAVEQAGGDRLAELRSALEPEPGRYGQGGFTGARSVGQTLSARITQGRPAGEPRQDRQIPADLSEPVSRWLEARHEQIRERERILGTEVAEEAPAWATRAFGPVPDEATSRLDWERRAGIVAAHREAVGFVDEVRPIGDRPELDEERAMAADRPIGDAPGITATERRGSWFRAYDALDRPEYGREEATMSEGALRSRIHAWKHEQGWAPAYAEEAQKKANLDAEAARTDAAFADGQDRESALGRARDSARVGDVMDATVQARRAWALETATMRAAAERAEKELEYRGVQAVGQESDRMTGEEWLAANVEGEAVEEQATTLVPETLVADEATAVEEEVEVHLEATVEDRSGDLAHSALVVPRQDRGEYRSAPVEPSEVELEALAGEAEAAWAVIEDRQSAEASATPDAIDRVEGLDDYPVEVEERTARDASSATNVARYS